MINYAYKLNQIIIMHIQNKLFKEISSKLLNQACAWFPEIVLQKVRVCMYAYLFAFPYPLEQTF